MISKLNEILKRPNLIKGGSFMKEVKLRQYAEKYFDPVEGLDENSTLWETEASDF